MHNNRKYCTHSLFFSKKTISHSKNIETNLSLSLRNEPLIPINSDTLLRTYRSRYLSLPLHIRVFTHQPTHLSPHFSLPTRQPLRTFTLIHPCISLFFIEAAPALAHLHHQSSTPAHPPQCTFACQLTQALHDICARSQSLLPRIRSGCLMQTSRCSHAVRGNVRRHWGKVYRVSKESL